MKIDLKDCTFIIPIKIDSDDRKKNAEIVLNYLCNNLNTNIIITETSYNDSLFVRELFSELISTNNITLIEKPNENCFHRTRYLNEMLLISQTPITINYDIDVLLPIDSYLNAKRMIHEKNFDLVYPYGLGDFQVSVPQEYRDTMVDKSLISTEKIPKSQVKKTWCGHVQFFKTDAYKSGFGENENFISFGPEDRERLYRFEKLGFAISYIKNSYVFHLEHERTADSLSNDANSKLWDSMKQFDKQQLLDYYQKQKYTKKFWGNKYTY